MRWKNRKGR